MTRVVVFTLVAAAVVFCAVQDRVTAGGVRQYVAIHRATTAEQGPLATIDDVMRPANRRSVQQGLLWGGAVAAAGLGGAALSSWSRRRE